MRQSHGCHDNAPKEHDSRDEDAGTKSLEEDVCQRFGEGVRDEEDGQSGVVLAASDVKGFFEADETGIANVGTIEKADQIEEAKPRYQAEIELPKQASVLCDVGNSFQRPE